MKNGFLMGLLLMPILSFANPAPYGFELGHLSVKEFKERHIGRFEGISEWSEGEMYTLLPAEIHLAGIKDITVIFDKNEMLVAILTILEKDRFFSLLHMLQANYTPISQEIPFVGDRTASFSDGNVQINLRAPRMGLDMYLEYVMLDFVDSLK